MKPFELNLKEVAKDNDDFRRVLFTSRFAQLVVMALTPGEEIGEEVHAVDQILYFVMGDGEAILDGDTQPIEKGDVVAVPAGVRHNIRNTGEGPMKLFTIYAPAEHAADTIHHTKAEALAGEPDLAPSMIGG